MTRTEQKRRVPQVDRKQMAVRETVARAVGREDEAAEWLTLRQAADRLQVGLGQMRRWAYKGIIPSHILPGGRGN